MEDMKEEIQDLMEELDAEKYHKGVSWMGYEVYVPDYTGEPKIGLPYVVLVKGSEARISSPEEAIQYLDYCISNDGVDED